MSLARIPEVGDLVTLEFDIVNGMDDSHKGQVLEVDTDPDIYKVELFVSMTDTPGNNGEIHYYVGRDADDNEYASVFRHSEFSGDTEIGENATLEVVA